MSHLVNFIQYVMFFAQAATAILSPFLVVALIGAARRHGKDF